MTDLILVSCFSSHHPELYKGPPPLHSITHHSALPLSLFRPLYTRASQLYSLYFFSHLTFVFTMTAVANRPYSASPASTSRLSTRDSEKICKLADKIIASRYLQMQKKRRDLMAKPVPRTYIPRYVLNHTFNISGICSQLQIGWIFVTMRAFPESLLQLSSLASSVAPSLYRSSTTVCMSKVNVQCPSRLFSPDTRTLTPMGIRAPLELNTPLSPLPTNVVVRSEKRSPPLYTTRPENLLLGSLRGTLNCLRELRYVPLITYYTLTSS